MKTAGFRGLHKLCQDSIIRREHLGSLIISRDFAVTVSSPLIAYLQSFTLHPRSRLCLYKSDTYAKAPMRKYVHVYIHAYVPTCIHTHARCRSNGRSYSGILQTRALTPDQRFSSILLTFVEALGFLV